MGREGQAAHHRRRRQVLQPGVGDVADVGVRYRGQTAIGQSRLKPTCRDRDVGCCSFLSRGYLGQISGQRVGEGRGEVLGSVFPAAHNRKPSDSPICNYFSSAVTQQEGIYLNSNAQNFARRFMFVFNTLCLTAIMAFMPVIGPVVRGLRLAEWHGGLVVTVAGVLWMLMARYWGGRSDRVGRRRVLLRAAAGYIVSYLLLAIGLDLMLREPPPAWLALLALMALLKRWAVDRYRDWY